MGAKEGGCLSRRVSPQCQVAGEDRCAPRGERQEGHRDQPPYPEESPIYWAPPCTLLYVSGRMFVPFQVPANRQTQKLPVVTSTHGE